MKHKVSPGTEAAARAAMDAAWAGQFGPKAKALADSLRWLASVRANVAPHGPEALRAAGFHVAPESLPEVSQAFRSRARFRRLARPGALADAPPSTEAGAFVREEGGRVVAMLLDLLGLDAKPEAVLGDLAALLSEPVGQRHSPARARGEDVPEDRIRYLVAEALQSGRGGSTNVELHDYVNAQLVARFGAAPIPPRGTAWADFNPSGVTPERIGQLRREIAPETAAPRGRPRASARNTKSKGK